MSDSYLPYANVATTDFKCDTEQLTVGANTVQRERIQVAGASALEIARVMNTTPSAADYALVMRGIGASHGAAAVGQGMATFPGKVRSSTSETAEADGDTMAQAVDGIGRLITVPFAHPINLITGNATASSTGAISLISQGGAGIRNYITSLTLINTSNTFVYVEFLDGATLKYRLPAPPNSGAAHALPSPLRGSSSSTWAFQASAAVSAILVSAAGYQSAI